MSAPRKNIMLGTAGHVDHGKTALVKMLTGCDLDTLPEEKARGLTIELGFAPCHINTTAARQDGSAGEPLVVGIVDVPGHVGFIRNMVAGAHGVDVVILVVAADDGVMPQTREHLDILSLMGVRRGLVALTKIDLVDATLRELVVEDVQGAIKGTFLEGCPICPVSNITGAGYDVFLTKLDEQIALCPERSTGGLFRLWVERSFSVRGFGTVASGIPVSGQVREGDRLTVIPTGQTVRVRGLEVYGEKSDTARAGECVAVNVTDITPEELKRGCLLCAGDPAAPVELFEAELQLLSSVPQGLKDYAEVHLHVGTAEAMGHVALLDAKRMEPGERRMAQIRLTAPLGVVPGDRYVIRVPTAYADGHLRTIGGGRVVGISNIRLRRNRPWTLQALEAQRGAMDDPVRWCELELERSSEPLTASALVKAARLPFEQVREILDGLYKAGSALEAGKGAYVHRLAVERWGEKIVQMMTEFHAQNPMRQGIEEEELIRQLAVPQAVFNLAVKKLSAENRALKQGQVWAVPGRAVLLSSQDQAWLEKIVVMLAQAGLAPPGPAELAQLLGTDTERVLKLIRLACDRGEIVQLNFELFMHRNAVAAGQWAVLELFKQAPAFETPQFRDAVGVSRKFAVPLLDYFDTIRLTVRSGSRRTPGALARQAKA